MYNRYNLVIDTIKDTIFCVDITEEKAWFIITAARQAMFDEEGWVYLTEGSRLKDETAVRREDISFTLDMRFESAMSIDEIEKEFKKCIKEIKEG